MIDAIFPGTKLRQIEKTRIEQHEELQDGIKNVNGCFASYLLNQMRKTKTKKKKADESEGQDNKRNH